MRDDSDPKFSMFLGSPDAYDTGQSPGTTSPDVAGAFGIIKRAKRAARGAHRIAKRSRGLANPAALSIRATKLAARGLATATGPLRRKIFRAFFSKLISRRARLIS